MKIGNIEFTESSYYVMKDGKVYRNVNAGLIENPMRTTRRVGNYKVCAEHFNCALPYTNYYVIDTKNEKIYESKDNTYSILEDIVNGLKNM